jgi:hypothetical protein
MSAEADEVGEEWEDDSEDADECLGLVSDEYSNLI